MPAKRSSRAYGLRKYGLDVAQYECILALQGGACWLCRRRPKTRRLSVDHDHKTGRIRGLLCYRCNRVLLNDNPALHERFAAYLRLCFDGRIFALNAKATWDWSEAMTKKGE